MITQGRIFLAVPFRERNKVRAIPSAQFHGGIKQWSWSTRYAAMVKAMFPWSREQVDNEMKLYTGDIPVSSPVATLPAELKPFNLEKEIEDVKVPIEIIESEPRPFRHQIKMLACCLKYDRFALFCEMGTGKTRVMIDLLQIRNVSTLVLAPKSVIFNWIEEIGKYSSMVAEVATGTRKQKEAVLLNGARIVITNYETVTGFTAEHFSRFEMIILDESSRIKNHKAKRTKAILKYFERKPYKYIMSGTPITQNPCDIYAQYAFLSPDFLGFKSFYSFRNTHCTMGGYQGYEIIGYKELEKLKDKISRHSIQLRKEECIDLPEKIYQVRYLEMPDGIRKQYDSMRKELVIELENDETVTATVVVTKILRLQEVLAGKYLTARDENPKIDTLQEIIEEAIECERQVVVWCRFRSSIDAIVHRLGLLGIPTSIIHGDVVDRQHEITEFQERRNKVFVGQIRTGGLGITLTAGDIMVYYENSFSLEDRKQSEDRIHRIGQKHACLYIDIVYKKTIDEDVIACIREKQDIARYLVKSFTGGNYDGRRSGKISTRAGAVVCPAGGRDDGADTTAAWDSLAAVDGQE